MSFREYLEAEGLKRGTVAAGARELLNTYSLAETAEEFQQAIVERAAGDATDVAGRHWTLLTDYEEIYDRRVDHCVAPTPEDDWEQLLVGHKRKEHRS